MDGFKEKFEAELAKINEPMSRAELMSVRHYGNEEVNSRYNKKQLCLDIVEGYNAVAEDEAMTINNISDGYASAYQSVLLIRIFKTLETLK